MDDAVAVTTSVGVNGITNGSTTEEAVAGATDAAVVTSEAAAKDQVREQAVESGDDEKEKERRHKKHKKKHKHKERQRSRSKSRTRHRSRSRSRSRSGSRGRHRRRSRSRSRNPRRDRDRERWSRRSRSRDRRYGGRDHHDRSWRGRSRRGRTSRSRSRSKTRHGSRSRSASRSRKLTSKERAWEEFQRRKGRRFNHVNRRRSKSPEGVAEPSAPGVETTTSSTGISMPSPGAIQVALQSQMLTANPLLTRQARRLYVGNLPTGMGLGERQLQEFFHNAAVSMGITTPQPVLSVWVSSEGTFCFVEFRSIQDATRCIALFNNLQLGGRPLRVGRPADYKPPPPHLENYTVGVVPGDNTAASVPAAVGAPFMASMPSMALGGAVGLAGPFGAGVPMVGSPMGFGAPAAAQTPAAQPTLLQATKVVLLTNMVELDDLVNDEDYNDLMEDTVEECNKFGPVKTCFIPRPPAGTDVKDAEQVKHLPVEIGKIFVVYETKEGALAGLQAVKGRQFNGRPVGAAFFDEVAFQSKDFSSLAGSQGPRAT